MTIFIDMVAELVHRKIVEGAEMLLGRAREYAGSTEAAFPPDGGWQVQLAGACEWIPEEAEEAIRAAVFTTFGSIADQIGLTEVAHLAQEANEVKAEAGRLLVCAVDDWLEHDGNSDAILDLGAETPGEIAAEHWIERWLKHQPEDARTLPQVAETAAAALSVALDLLPEGSDEDTVAWWVGPDPNHDDDIG